MIKRINSKVYYTLLFLLPGLIIYTVFMVYPLLDSLRLSLFKGAGLVPKEFVGLENYIRLFTQNPYRERFLNALLHSVIFFVVLYIFNILYGYILSIMVTRRHSGLMFFRVIYYIPRTLSVLVVGFLFSLMLNPVFGIFDKIFLFLGMDFMVRPWLGDPKTALVLIGMITSWHHLGVPILFFTASIDGIPEELYDAANVDGVNTLGMVRHIITPLLKPMIRLVTVLTFVADFVAFDIVYAMATSRGNPDYATDLTGTFFYRTAFGAVYGARPDMGLGAAVAFILLIIIIVGVLLIFYIFKERDNKL